MAIERQTAYDIIYALAARDGREGALFGRCAPLAREAFARSLCGCAFPELWFEVPLVGDPWFDLHMLVSRQDVQDGDAFAGLDGAYADALAWFAGSEDTRQLALSFDTGTGDVCHPAVQLLLNCKSMVAPRGFLGAVGRADLADAYCAFVSCMHGQWYACYSGVFPARPNTDWVRVECIVGEASQRAYADGPRTLREHLVQVGMDVVDEAFLSHVAELAQSPFPLELQFDVGQDGRALPRLGASVRFQLGDWEDPRAREAVERLFRMAEEWGLADERWRRLGETVFSKRVTKEDETAFLWCFPAFLKVRWREGQGVDAKSYLMASFDSNRPCESPVDCCARSSV